MNTQTITIPKNLTKEKKLVLISFKEYEELLRVSKKKGYTQLDKDLDEALEDVKKGRLIGPFSSIKEGLRILKQTR